MIQERPDLGHVLRSLKDFQRETVDYVFHRLYEDESPTDRFLVADEVGLGKTLVARGVVAKTVDRLWEEVERIDVVYVCSNGEIARQNIKRLNVTDRDEFALPSRITLLPTQVHELQNHRLNFVALTPGTSLEPKSKLGLAKERALLHVLLDQAWDLGSSKAPMKVLQGYADLVLFEDAVKGMRQQPIDEDLATRFIEDLNSHDDRLRAEGSQTLRARFDDLCERMRWVRRLSRLSEEDKRDRQHLVGELRSVLAATCITALEPDLVILDEFQRFKHLLKGDDDASRLAQELFSWQDRQGDGRTRVILLSATPYKMYTLPDGSGGEDHFQDFIATLRFLYDDEDETRETAELVTMYRRELFTLASGNGDQVTALKKRLEDRLRSVMVRTERLAATEDRNGMLIEVSKPVGLTPSELRQYMVLQDLAEILHEPDVLEYWKSAPYLLNFMEGYQLKRKLEDAVSAEGSRKEITELLIEHPEVDLDWADVTHYKRIDPGNARMRDLFNDTIDSSLWRMLWIPPSLPYYVPEGPFEQANDELPTKRLVFSGWQVVPKAIAALASYAAEREMMCAAGDPGENSPEGRARRARLLDFGQTEGRPVGMPVLGLIYPGQTLAAAVDPLVLAAGCDGQPPSADSIVAAAVDRIKSSLDELEPGRSGGAVDEAWYWAAPILMDLSETPDATREWFDDPGLPLAWAGLRDRSDAPSGWVEHVQRARSLLNDGSASLGPKPQDLAEVVARLGLAGPAVTALRTLGRVSGNQTSVSLTTLRDRAGAIGWSLRNLFNLPEVTALVRGMNPEEPYWRRVLDYCFAGCLQSVLDEYAHTLVESLGLFDEKSETVVSGVADEMDAALGLRATSMRVDDIRLDPETEQARIDSQPMRTRFAARFGDGRSDDGTVTRPDQLRRAFNSPFWPMVLATTSVGQEGLDFHTYCHAVVHWNLPSNPVDLEQREGRVHRYKGHAIRKNLATRYGLSSVAGSAGDPWAHMFDLAIADRKAGDGDLVPFWIYAPDEKSARIERHVPALPLSRDLSRLDALRRSLAVYRMAFGQARQEDLVAYLLSHLSEDDIERELDGLRIDLSPPRMPQSAASATSVPGRQ